MKNKLSTPLLAMALLLVSNSFAQEGFRIGAKAIVQSTWMFNKDDSDAASPAYISTFGPAGGLSLGYNFTPTVGLGLDFIYSAQGQRYDVDATDDTYEFRQNMKYLKLPLLFQVNSDPSTGGVMFLFRVGPQFGLLMNAEGEDVESGITIDNKNFYESLNIAAAFSLGVAIPLGETTQLTTSFRADYAFTDAEDKSATFLGGPAWVDSRAVTNNVTGGIEIGFNYLFGASGGGSGPLN